MDEPPDNDLSSSNCRRAGNANAPVAVKPRSIQARLPPLSTKHSIARLRPAPQSTVRPPWRDLEGYTDSFRATFALVVIIVTMAPGLTAPICADKIDRLAASPTGAALVAPLRLMGRRHIEVDGLPVDVHRRGHNHH